MTTQEDLESAFQKIVENAEANCPFDTYRPWVIEDVGANRIVNTMNDCTCDATIDAAAEGMLAAMDFGNLYCADLTKQKATINRLREEAKK